MGDFKRPFLSPTWQKYMLEGMKPLQNLANKKTQPLKKTCFEHQK